MCISKAQITSWIFPQLHIRSRGLPVWSLPPVFFIPIGLIVYFSLCFQCVLFWAREAVVRKPLPCTNILGTRDPTLDCVSICGHKKSETIIITIKKYYTRFDDWWILCLRSSDKVGKRIITWKDPFRKPTAPLRPEFAIITSCRQLWTVGQINVSASISF